MSEKTKVTLKSFQCKDLLWQVFEDMAKEYGVTVDYLINAALLEFANSKNYIELPKRQKPKYTLDDNKPITQQEDPDTPLPEAQKVPPIKPKIPPIPPKNTTQALKLVVEFEGEVIPVEKEQFIIGRGSAADLRLQDPSVSRQHAVVFQKDGVYYIKDLGSTNGFEFEGQRYNVRRISSNETYSICNFDFTFKFIE